MTQAPDIRQIQKFIQFAAKELKLPSMPQIKLVGHQEDKYSAFGHSQGKLIVCRVTERHVIDICRTLAHELQHFRQNILGMRMGENAKEDDANLIAGRILRKFDVSHPEAFKDPVVRGNMLHEQRPLRENALQAAPVNSMGASSGSASTGSIAGFDPLMNFKRKMKLPQKPLKSILKQGLENDKK